MVIFLLEMMSGFFVNVSLVPSLQLNASPSMNYLAALDHHEPKTLWVASANNCV